MTGNNQPYNPYPQNSQAQGMPVQYDPVTGTPLAQPAQQTQIQQPPQYASTGVPEAPAQSQAETAPQAPEYGNEAIRRIEQQAQPEQRAERQETPRPPVAQPQKRSQPKPQKAETAPAPKFYGYSIPPQLASNITMIKQNQGKGDPGNARTWLYVFLDRLLKKQSPK